MSEIRESNVYGYVSTHESVSSNENIYSAPAKVIYPCDSALNFPTTGKTNALYIDKSTTPNVAYRWDPDLSGYVPVGGGGSGGGVTDYERLQNLPTINGVTVQGNMTPENIGAFPMFTGADETDPDTSLKGLMFVQCSDELKAILGMPRAYIYQYFYSTGAIAENQTRVQIATAYGDVAKMAIRQYYGSPKAWTSWKALQGIAGGSGGADGADGISPTVSVTEITDGHRITITDVNGTQSFDVMDGEDGVGIKSVIQTTTSTADKGTNVITVTKTDGSTSTFSVRNGSKGSQGENGVGITSITQSERGSLWITTSDGKSGVFELPTGKSAYEIALENGFEGTEAEWVESLKGDDGTGVTILGSYNSVGDLNAAHPVGSVGDAYLVNGNLYVWSEIGSAWENVGNIQGPKGDPGEKGDTGAQGPRGEKGDTGAQGADGFSPTVEIDEIANGHEVTITDANGEQSFSIMDGSAGIYIKSAEETTEEAIANAKAAGAVVIFDPSTQQATEVVTTASFQTLFDARNGAVKLYDGSWSTPAGATLTVAKTGGSTGCTGEGNVSDYQFLLLVSGDTLPLLVYNNGTAVVGGGVAFSLAEYNNNNRNGCIPRAIRMTLSGNTLTVAYHRVMKSANGTTTSASSTDSDSSAAITAIYGIPTR